MCNCGSPGSEAKFLELEEKRRFDIAGAAAAWIENNWAPGTILRHKATGERYMLGFKEYSNHFWMMPYKWEERKGIWWSRRIVTEFERIE